MMVKKKIAFLCNGNPLDKSLWSGTTFKMYEQFLRLGYDIEHIPAAKFTQTEERIFEKIASLHETVFNRTFNRHQFLLKSWIASRRTKKLLNKKQFDYLFCVSQINDIAFLRINQPIIFVNDALLEQMIGYYPYYKGLSFYSKKIFKYLEKKALHNCQAVLFPSKWSVDRAKLLFGIPEKNIHLLRFGANIEIPNAHIQKDFTKGITLLFLSVDWERKAGNIALAATEILTRKGFNVKLLVVGCVPPKASEAMEVIPFLNKNNAEDFSRMIQILEESQLLFVPTRAECYGIVFCEASAYSIPSIATDTGGVTSIIENGINGYTLPLDAKAEDYADKIEEILLSGQLEELSKSTRKRYEEFLDWKHWGNQVNKIIANIR